MRNVLVAAMVVSLFVIVAGCSAAKPFQRVDLSAPLSSADLQRYESEWQEAHAAAHGGHMHHAVLEHSNWWPLGLLIYHRDATVMRMESPDGPVYHIMYGEGYGPLSLIYAVSTHATYNAKGTRLSWMRMSNILLAHIAMGHESVTTLPNGEEETCSTLHLLMHLFSIDKMNGHTYVSILSLPNPIGSNVDGE